MYYMILISAVGMHTCLTCSATCSLGIPSGHVFWREVIQIIRITKYKMFFDVYIYWYNTQVARNFSGFTNNIKNKAQVLMNPCLLCVSPQNNSQAALGKYVSSGGRGAAAQESLFVADHAYWSRPCRFSSRRFTLIPPCHCTPSHHIQLEQAVIFWVTQINQPFLILPLVKPNDFLDRKTLPFEK